MDDLHRIRKPRLVDEIVARLQRELLTGRWAAGDALPPERELSERFGVTRTSLKHALVRLEALGVIRTQHGVGSIVQDLLESGSADLLKHLVSVSNDRELLSEVLEARALTVVQFARLAAERASRRELERLRATVDLLFEMRDDIREVQRLENAFTRGLAGASHNRAFALLANSVSAAYKLQAETFRAPFADGARIHRGLTKILERLESNDVAGAEAATRAYFEDYRKALLDTPKPRRTRKKRP